MSTGQRLRQVKEDISRIERFLPVMKRVLTLLRVEIRNYQERIIELEQQQQEQEQKWRACGESALAQGYRGVSGGGGVDPPGEHRRC